MSVTKFLDNNLKPKFKVVYERDKILNKQVFMRDGIDEWWDINRKSFLWEK